MLTVFLLDSRSEPSDVGMLSLAAFLQFWGLVFLATTVFVCFFKAEAGDGLNYKVVGLFDTYRQVKLGFALCRSLLLSCWRLHKNEKSTTILSSRIQCRSAIPKYLHYTIDFQDIFDRNNLNSPARNSCTPR